MSILLLSDLARVRADSSRRARHSVHSASERLAELGRLSARLETTRPELAADARTALRYTLAEAEEVRAFWDEVKELFRAGVEGEQGREILRFTLDLFDSFLGLAEATSQYRDLTAQLGVDLTPREQLDTTIRELKDLRTAAEAWRDFLFRPRPVIDPARLDAARQAVARGQFKDAEGVRKEVLGT